MHLEGQQAVLAALRARKRRFRLILIKNGSNPARIAEVVHEAERLNIPVKYVVQQELDALAFGRSHGGVVALCSRKPLLTPEALDEIFIGQSQPLMLLLEGVEDAQHLGYLLRTAEALGAHAVWLKKHLWDFDETAVARASSGAFERLPLIKFSEVSQLRVLTKREVKLWGCIARARRSVYDLDLTGPVALAVGGEKRGLSGKLRERCDGFVRIPMAENSASSLALTHAACLLLGEAFRQRQAQRVEKGG